MTENFTGVKVITGTCSSPQNFSKHPWIQLKQLYVCLNTKPTLHDFNVAEHHVSYTTISNYPG